MSAQNNPQEDFHDLPSYEEVTEKGADSKPPAYNVASKLPTYEEAQQEKPTEASSNDHYYAFVSFPRINVNEEDPDQRNLILGTDTIFLASFFVAFLFNWIGFLVLLCACHTIAGRYGALSGFGLSLAKWTLIVKHSTDIVSNDNNWLWWLVMALGLLLSARALVQYLSIKREWNRLSRSVREPAVLIF